MQFDVAKTSFIVTTITMGVVKLLSSLISNQSVKGSVLFSMTRLVIIYKDFKGTQSLIKNF